MTLAPSGTLRVGINLANPLLVAGSAADGSPQGVAPALGAALAARSGLAHRYVTYPGAGQLATANDWDVAFLADDPARAATIAFSPAYAEIDVRYLVHIGSALSAVPDAGRLQAVVIAEAGSAYELWLSARLPPVRLVRADGPADALHRFASDENAVLAGLAPSLTRIAAEDPATRLLPGRVTAVRQAIGVPAGDCDAALQVATFVREALARGLVRELVERYGVSDSLVIPEL